MRVWQSNWVSIFLGGGIKSRFLKGPFLGVFHGSLSFMGLFIFLGLSKTFSLSVLCRCRAVVVVGSTS